MPCSINSNSTRPKIAKSAVISNEWIDFKLKQNKKWNILRNIFRLYLKNKIKLNVSKYTVYIIFLNTFLPAT